MTKEEMEIKNNKILNKVKECKKIIQNLEFQIEEQESLIEGFMEDFIPLCEFCKYGNNQYKCGICESDYYKGYIERTDENEI